MKTQNILVALTMVGSLILAACATPGAAPVSLDNTSWLLVTLNGHAQFRKRQAQRQRRLQPLYLFLHCERQ
jgi:hypothetical protein